MEHPVLGNADWMTWNLILALVPAFLAARLFRSQAHRGLGWWLGVAAFVAFLPNAPYVLTDVVHMPADLRAASGGAPMTFAVLVVYAGLAVVGFSAYAFSVLRLLAYLRAQGVRTVGIITTELAVHGLAATGIVLGRVFRFNSWDLLARPGEILESLRLPPSDRGVAIVALLVLTLVVGTLIARTLARLARRWPAT